MPGRLVAHVAHTPRVTNRSKRDIRTCIRIHLHCGHHTGLRPVLGTFDPHSATGSGRMAYVLWRTSWTPYRDRNQKSATAVRWGRSLRTVLPSRIFDFGPGAASKSLGEKRPADPPDSALLRPPTLCQHKPSIDDRGLISWLPTGSANKSQLVRPSCLLTLQPLLARQMSTRAPASTRP